MIYLLKAWQSHFEMLLFKVIVKVYLLIFFLNALASYFIFDFRDNITSKDPDVEYRRKEFDDIFKRLETAGK